MLLRQPVPLPPKQLVLRQSALPRQLVPRKTVLLRQPALLPPQQLVLRQSAVTLPRWRALIPRWSVPLSPWQLVCRKTVLLRQSTPLTPKQVVFRQSALPRQSVPGKTALCRQSVPPPPKQLMKSTVVDESLSTNATRVLFQRRTTLYNMTQRSLFSINRTRYSLSTSFCQGHLPWLFQV